MKSSLNENHLWWLGAIISFMGVRGTRVLVDVQKSGLFQWILRMVVKKYVGSVHGLCSIFVLMKNLGLMSSRLMSFS